MQAAGPWLQARRQRGHQAGHGQAPCVGACPPPPHTTLGREINVDVDRQAFEDSATSWHVLGCLCSAMRQDSPPCCTLREAASVDKFDPQLRESCQGRADCELSVLWCGGELHQPCCQVHQRV